MNSLAKTYATWSRKFVFGVCAKLTVLLKDRCYSATNPPYFVLFDRAFESLLSPFLRRIAASKKERSLMFLLTKRNRMLVY